MRNTSTVTVPTHINSLGSTRVVRPAAPRQGQTYASSYDAWGNVTSRNVNGTTATLSYDGLDHLTKYDAGSSGQEQYVYDASGERVLRRSTSAGSTTMTVYAFGLEEHLYSGSGVNQGNTYYYSLGSMLIGEFDATNTNMFLTDALGSVIETISATAGSAAVQGNQVYSPYGSSRYQQGRMDTTKGFTGQYTDSVSGLDYYNSRYYDSVVGRFLSVDKASGNMQGMDPYAYVGDNPETKNDPTGQFFAPPPSGGAPPPPPPPPPSSSNTGNTSSTHPAGTSPATNFFNGSEAVLISLKYGININKFVIDDLFFRNAPAALADLLGALDLRFPVFSNEDVLKGLASLLKISPHNSGRLYSSLEASGNIIGDIAGGLSHLANGVTFIYDVVDLAKQFTSGSPNYTQVAADETSLASIILYYLAKRGNESDSKLLLGASFAFAGISFLLSLAAFAQNTTSNSPPPNNRDGGDRNDNGSSRGGGGGLPPLPPLIPAAAFLLPAMNEQQPSYPGQSSVLETV